MARIVKEYDERYTEFLDVAQTLFFTNGYEQTSVQQIIKTVGVAKGTFYHYFDSKTEILEALVTRIVAQTAELLAQLVADDTLSAPEKLEQFFTQVNQWYSAHQTEMLATLRIIFQDDNVLLREKMYTEMKSVFVPLLEQIIQQGVTEQTFNVVHTLEVAEVVWMLTSTFDQSFIRSILFREHNDVLIEKIKRELAVFNMSLARVLGAAEDTLTLFHDTDLTLWIQQ